MNDPGPHRSIRQANNSREVNNFSICGKEPMSRNIKRFSAGLSLVTLALGFFLLGILSFLRWHGELAIESAMEQCCCVAGGAVSVFTGTVFFVAACLYWRR
jgi:hypothetical protein